MEKKHKNLINISIVLAVILIVPLIVFFVGTSFGLFKYAKEGQTRSVVKIGGIRVTILNDSENNLDLINGYPMPDSEGLLRNPIEFNIENVGTQKALDITLKLVNDTEAQNNCVIEGTNTPCTALSANKIRYAYKINNGSYSTPANLGENNNIIFNDLIDPQEVMKVSLVIWIDKEAGNEIQESYFYGNLVITGEKSDSCGSAICENQTFAQYMVAQDQAAINQYVNIKAPTGGSSADSFTGLAYYDDWRKAFARPIEYASKYQQKFTSVNATYPDVNNSSAWTGYHHGNAAVLVPRIADDVIYNNKGKHINMWFVRVTGRNDGQNVNPINFSIFGTYVPPTGAAWKCVTNQPTNGYAAFKFETNTEGVYIPGASTFPFKSRSWEPGGYWGSGYGTGYLPGNFILVYNVDAFKAYLDTLSNGDYRAMIDNYAYVLAECNIPKEKNH